MFDSSALKAKKEMEDGRKASLEKDFFLFSLAKASFSRFLLSI